VVAPNDLGINEACPRESLELLIRVHVQNPVTWCVGAGRQVVADQYFRGRSKERRELSVQPMSVSLVSQFMNGLERDDKVDRSTDEAWPRVGLEVRA
jgi:hypothetical protein